MTVASSELLPGRWNDVAITERLVEPVFVRPRALRWLLLFTAGGTLMLFAAIAYTFAVGIGAWGNNIPVAWGFGIINFVFWIGIGHAGTFISAILLLLEQHWRTTLNRLAEGMTLFALVQAAMMPLLHLGRPWFAYWLVPYPATMRVWPQFMSSLPWDVAAISTYTLISLLFWYLGTVPDFAVVRDRAKSLVKRRIYGVLALGWRGSADQWRHHRMGQLLLAGLATPLVLSVHSIVSLDFAITKLPGWHSVIFPPYFVSGAIFSGFAMVVLLAVPIRYAYRLENVITTRHFDLISKMLLVTGLIVAYSYFAESFSAFYSGDEFERAVTFRVRWTGPLAWSYWLTLFCNVVAIQPLWFRSVRRRPWAVFVVSLFVEVGMWFERFMIIVTSQHRDFLPSSWGMYEPTIVDGAILGGSFCFFLFLFLLMVRYVPFIAISETKEMHREIEHQARQTVEPVPEGAR